MNCLLLFFILHLAILNVFFIGQFLIKKYAHLLPLLCLSAVVIVQVLLTQLSLAQQQIKIQKQQNLEAKEEVLFADQIQLDENANTIKLNGVSPRELDKLKQNLEHVLSLTPDHRDVLFNLGIIALYQKNSDEANEYFAKSRYQDPNSVLFLENF